MDPVADTAPDAMFEVPTVSDPILAELMSTLPSVADIADRLVTDSLSAVIAPAATFAAVIAFVAILSAVTALDEICVAVTEFAASLSAIIPRQQ